MAQVFHRLDGRLRELQTRARAAGLELHLAEPTQIQGLPGAAAQLPVDGERLAESPAGFVESAQEELGLAQALEAPGQDLPGFELAGQGHGVVEQGLRRLGPIRPQVGVPEDAQGGRLPPPVPQLPAQLQGPPVMVQGGVDLVGTQVVQGVGLASPVSQLPPQLQGALQVKPGPLPVPQGEVAGPQVAQDARLPGAIPQLPEHLQGAAVVDQGVAQLPQAPVDHPQIGQHPGPGWPLVFVQQIQRPGVPLARPVGLAQALVDRPQIVEYQGLELGTASPAEALHHVVVTGHGLGEPPPGVEHRAEVVLGHPQTGRIVHPAAMLQGPLERRPGLFQVSRRQGQEPQTVQGVGDASLPAQVAPSFEGVAIGFRRIGGISETAMDLRQGLPGPGDVFRTTGGLPAPDGLPIERQGSSSSFGIRLGRVDLAGPPGGPGRVPRGTTRSLR